VRGTQAVSVYRRPRRGNRIRLGRQIYLYLHRFWRLRPLGPSPRLDNRRRWKPPANPLLPLRQNRHPTWNAWW